MKDKAESEVLKSYQAKLKGMINLEECSEIMKSIYNEQDCSILTDQIYLLISLSSPSHSRSDLIHFLSLQPSNKPLLPFLQFQNLLLSYMFDQHLLFLSKFVKLFNKYDPD
jgi:hypothetical protein